MRLRGSHAERHSSLNTTGENQWIPGQNRNVTYVTRLQGLQAAVDHQLEQLAKDHPGRRVALVTFSNEVACTDEYDLPMHSFSYSMCSSNLICLEYLSQHVMSGAGHNLHKVLMQSCRIRVNFGKHIAKP